MRIKLWIFISVVVGTTLAFGAPAGADGKKLSRELNIFNWDDYFGPTTLKDFERQFGVTVNWDIYKDEEEAISGLQSNPGKYDIIVIGDDEISRLIEMRMLESLDLDNIPNLKNIERRFRNPWYDPGHKHSVPYTWGTTGLVINRSYIKEKVDSWNILWNPKYKGKMALLNDPEDIMAVALSLLGYSMNTTNPAQLEEGREKLLQQKPLLAGYLDFLAIRDMLITNKLWAAHQFSGDGMYAVDKNRALEYIIPKEGALIWVDAMAVPRDPPHKYTAEVFINYILDAKVSAKITNYLWYASPNVAARPYILREILKSPSLYPSEEVLKKCETYHLRGSDEERRKAQQIINKTWADLRLND